MALWLWLMHHPTISDSTLELRGYNQRIEAIVQGICASENDLLKSKIQNLLCSVHGHS